jgi:V/A-type H+-transporting ATPase subunit I
MFKPARMTRILVGGHRDHLEAAVEELYAAGAVHLEDYRDPTAITHMGTPFERGDEVTGLLLRARGLQKALGTDAAEPRDMPRDKVIEAVAEAESACLPVLDRLAQARARTALLHAETEQLEAIRGLDADLGAARTVSSLRVYIGTVREDPGGELAKAGLDSDVVLHKRGRDFVAAVSVRAGDASAAERALADAGFAAIQLPDVDGTPGDALRLLGPRLTAAEEKVTKLEQEADALRTEWGGRLATVEHELAAEADQTQAPLHFGVTANTFHVEGWVARRRAKPLQVRLRERFGSSLYIELLGDAPLGHAARDAGGHGARAAGDGRAAGAVGDGHAAGAVGDGHATAAADEPPTKLENKGPSRNYEFLLGLLALPKYKELDPTKLLAIFFPLFFGLMVGDVAIGLIIMVLALWLRQGRIFGIGGAGVAKPMFWGGVWAVLVGLFIFGEALGLHFVVSDEALADGEHSWESVLGAEFPTHGFIHKADSQGHEAAALHATAHDSLAGYVASDDHSPGAAFSPHQEHATEEGSLLAGFAPHAGTHLSVNGWFNLGYYSKIHDVEALLLWSVSIGFVHLVLGFVLGVRNMYVGHGLKLAVQERVSWLLIIASTIGIIVGLQSGLAALLWPAVGVFVVAVALLWMGAQHTLGVGFVAILELPSLLGNLLSYTRLAAIGASKAGMAIAFATIGFELVGGPVGWIIYLGAAALITLLAVLAGFLQSLRLQFVEFFSKFYEGGGRPYHPFGRRAA